MNSKNAIHSFRPIFSLIVFFCILILIILNIETLLMLPKRDLLVSIMVGVAILVLILLDCYTWIKKKSDYKR